jgi:hypothetical protein
MKYWREFSLGLCMLAACGSDEGPDVELHVGDPFHVAVVSGGDQNVRPATQLPEPITIEVRDIDDRLLYDSRVQWSLAEYANELRTFGLATRTSVGSVTPTVSHTDASGRASAQVVVPPEYGWYVVHGIAPNRLSGDRVARAYVLVTDGTRGELQLVSGTSQTGTPGTILPEPLVVQVREATGAPARNTEVRFTNTRYGGAPSLRYVDASAQESSSYYAVTDDAGRVTVRLRLIPGGSQTATATAIVGVPRFGLTAYAGFVTR